MIPLTVLGGYLGAGKTTLVNRLLGAPPAGQRLAVLVNDFGAINVDAQLIRQHTGTTIELTSGCVCCSVQDDLGAALETARRLNVTGVLIEASGVALPAKIADYGHTWPGYRLARILVAVDALDFPRRLQDKYVGQLLRDQVAQADLVLVTKLDLAAPAERGAVLARLDQALRRTWLRADTLASVDLLALAAPPHDTGATARRRAPGVEAHASFCTVSIDLPQPLPRDAMERLLGELPPAIVRVKGWFHDLHGSAWLVQRVGARWTLEPHSGAPPGGCLVAIAPAAQLGSSELRATLEARLTPWCEPASCDAPAAER